MSAKVAVLIILSFVGSAFLGFFLGSIGHENKINNDAIPAISQSIMQNQNPETASTSKQNDNTQPSITSPAHTTPSFQYGNGTH